MYSMIARILEQQQAICAVLADDRKNWHRMPSDREFTTLEIVSQVLQPLSVFSDALSWESQVTVSAIRPLLKHITTSLLSMLIKETITDSLGSRYICREVLELIDKCSFLDLRFKTNALSDNASTIAQLKAEAKEIVESLDGAAEPEGAPPPPKKSKGLGAILLKVAPDKPQRAESVTERIGRSLITSSCCQILTLMEPLSWWKREQHSFPILAQLAHKYLCVCGTSVPSERLFSQAGYIVNEL